jgi:iron(III) transport system substrate-binding protein
MPSVMLSPSTALRINSAKHLSSPLRTDSEKNLPTRERCIPARLRCKFRIAIAIYKEGFRMRAQRRSAMPTPMCLILTLLMLVVFAAETRGASATLAQTIEGAKKEGTIRGQWSQNTFGGGEGFTEFVAGMNKKYGLNLKGQFTPGPDMQALMVRIAQEAAAGQPASTDLYMGNAQALLEGLKQQALKPVEWGAIIDRRPPKEAGFDPIAADGTHIAVATAVVGIEYNTNFVKGADIPKRLTDVLNPKWKGKIASTPYAAGMRELAMPGFLGREYVLDFTKKLSGQIGGLIRCGEAERLTSGEFVMLVLTCGGNDATVLQRSGAPLAHTMVQEGTVLHMRYAAIPKNSRSPNAAALMAAYWMTPEGQELLWKHDGLDLHLFPESHMKKDVEAVRAAGGKVVINSPEWLGSLKGYAEMQKELEKILREGGK